MKKVFIILAASVALASCDDQMKEARQFAEEFSTAVTSGDSTTLNRIYPDASKADSLALNYVADSLQLEPNATGDTLQIRFSPDVSVTAVKDGEGKYSVIGSHGLFAYPPERLEYAKSTGQFVDSLDDISNAERMADKGFDDFLAQKLKSQLNGALKIVSKKEGDSAEGEGGMMAPMSLTVTVENTSEMTIPGNAYRVIITTTDWDANYLDDVTTTHPLAGKDINPGERQSFKYKHPYVGARFSSRVQMLNTGGNMVSGYTPKGNEYSEYLSSKQ
ncbi:MAG: hypothetical protein IKQ77_11025 [Prevotella sp.]|nr:hypothetical protein [Prevotella sp.]